MHIIITRFVDGGGSHPICIAPGLSIDIEHYSVTEQQWSVL